MALPTVHATVDYNKFPQRLHKYPASDRAQKIMHDAFTMDALFGTAWPVQSSTPDGPEFHDVMAQDHDWQRYRALGLFEWEPGAGQCLADDERDALASQERPAITPSCSGDMCVNASC